MLVCFSGLWIQKWCSLPVATPRSTILITVRLSSSILPVLPSDSYRYRNDNQRIVLPIGKPVLKSFWARSITYRRQAIIINNNLSPSDRVIGSHFSVHEGSSLCGEEISRTCRCNTEHKFNNTLLWFEIFTTWLRCNSAQHQITEVKEFAIEYQNWKA